MCNIALGKKKKRQQKREKVNDHVRDVDNVRDHVRDMKGNQEDYHVRNITAVKRE